VRTEWTNWTNWTNCNVQPVHNVRLFFDLLLKFFVLRLYFTVLFAVEVARAKFPFLRKGWQAKPDGVGFQGNYYAEKKIKSCVTDKSLSSLIKSAISSR
jgi:hypothetical protein